MTENIRKIIVEQLNKIKNKLIVWIVKYSYDVKVIQFFT